MHNKKHKTLLFKSYSEENTFNIIIHIFASSPSIPKILKFYQPVIVKRHYIYQFWLLDMVFFEMWRGRSRSKDGQNQLM